MYAMKQANPPKSPQQFASRIHETGFQEFCWWDSCRLVHCRSLMCRGQESVGQALWAGIREGSISQHQSPGHRPPPHHPHQSLPFPRRQPTMASIWPGHGFLSSLQYNNISSRDTQTQQPKYCVCAQLAVLYFCSEDGALRSCSNTRWDITPCITCAKIEKVEGV